MRNFEIRVANNAQVINLQFVCTCLWDTCEHMCYEDFANYSSTLTVNSNDRSVTS